MPTPATHYRIAFGEHSGEHSWIIHSAKGIKWHNIPDELVTLLQKLTINELLDFSLGSDGKWYVRYGQKGAERHEISPYLWKELNLASKMKLDRLTLGPDTDHWGVCRVSDGSFRTFSSVGTRDKLTRLLGWKAGTINSKSKIGFVALGFAGDWAFSVNGQAKYRCSKPFQKEFSDGLRAQKRVSTVVLSSMARLWIIVWEDGTLSHNLPSKIAGQVNAYCQLKHSLKLLQNAPKVTPPRNLPQADQPPGDVAPVPAGQTLPKPTPAPPPPVQTTVDEVHVPKALIAATSTPTQQPPARPAPAQPPTLRQVSKPPAVTQLETQVPCTTGGLRWSQLALSSEAGHPISRVETIPAEPDHAPYRPPKKLSTTLRQLDPTDWVDSYYYEEVVRLFQDGWKHPHKRCPKIKRIFSVGLPDHLNESYQEYKDNLETRHGWNGINERQLFHGTTCSCFLGEGEGDFSLCGIWSCSLCSILRTSFLVSKAGSAGRSFRRSGPGIYTSSVSSMADDYSSTPSYSPNKVVIIAKAALGKSSIQYRTTESLTAPPWGYDSVLREGGIDPNHDEHVVYRNEAIRPTYVIIYERPTSALAYFATPRVYLPPKTTLRQLDPTDWSDSSDYSKVSRLFMDGWKHQDKSCPKIKRIFVVSLPDHLNESYQEYKDDLETRHGWSGINEKLLFHGTTRSCSLGEVEGDLSVCEIPACKLCSILRTSFLVSKAGSANRWFKRFGPGIYTSSVSSKADDYSITPSYSLHNVIIVAKVALGKSSIQYRTNESLTAPPWGYDSVLGEVGMDLNHDEQVVYKNEAVRPAYVIIYERPTSGLTYTTATTTTSTQPTVATTIRPAATQNYSTYNPFQAATSATSTHPAQSTTAANWFGQTATTPTTNLAISAFFKRLFDIDM